MDVYYFPVDEMNPTKPKTKRNSCELILVIRSIFVVQFVGKEVGE